MPGHGRRKKRRASSQDEELARRRFLEALEAQRANARIQKVEKTCSTAVETRPSSGVVQLPGFYYDEAKRRYFRTCPTSEQHEREQSKVQEQKRQVEVQQLVRQVNNNRQWGYGTNGHNWVTYLSRRQSDFAWSARGRDRRALMSQYLAGVLSSQVVEALNMTNGDRLTALGLHSGARTVGAISASSGRLNIFRLQRRSHEAESTTSSQLSVPIYDFSFCGVVTSLQWRPVQELELLACHLGSDPRNISQTTSGNVYYLRVGDQETRGVALVSMVQMKRMKLVDPWTAKWNPAETSKFSIGCSGSSSAAYVDAVANGSHFQCAPSGVLTSDVHAQSFFSTGHVVLNGTKNGGVWGWDVRSPRRIFEWEVESTSDQSPGSVLDIHMLNDCRRAVVQRSNGELRVVDLRTFKPVVEFIQGATKHYLPSLRCAIDSSESVVVSGGDAKYPLAVNSYDIRSGRRVASLEMPNVQTSEKRPTFVQQVQLASAHYRSRYKDTPEIWAISHNELYVCSGPTDSGMNEV
ncbi:unnamed protein product [Peronospora belbahrii]|uniref:Uncharacterized protein n=1 Tax=Peronospora belbahrii TaxID=622444 RepID=A0ABN8CRH9_9STRA|nr:unnamed protein product [Peronospora belbahrii]